MASFSLSDAQAVLKEFWGRDSIVRTCGTLIPLYDEFMTKSGEKGDFEVRKGVSGRGLNVLVPVQTGYNHGYNIVAENGAIPTPLTNSYEQLTWPTYKPMVAVQLSLETIAATRNNEYSFIRGIKTETENAERSVIERLAAQMIVDGTGFLGQVAAAVTAGATITVDNPGTRLMQRFQYIDVWTAKSGGSREVRGQPATDNRYILAIPDDGTIILNGNVTVSNDSWIFISESPRTEIMGLLSIVSDGTDGGATSIAGINRSTDGNEWVDGRVYDGAGDPFSEDFVQSVLDSVEFGDYGWTDDSDKNDNVPRQLVVGDFETRKYLVQVLTAQKRIMGTALTGGAEKVDYDWFGKRIRFCWDKRAWPGRLYALNPRSLKWYVAVDWEWWDTGGGPMSKDFIGGTASVIGQMYSIMNLACEHFPSNAYGFNYDAPA